MEIIANFAEVVELARMRAPVYVRYSAGPARDAETPSHDVEADVALPGIPAASLSPEPWWTRPDEDWVARRLCTYLDPLEHDGNGGSRRPWLLTGVLVGYGTDHEALIGAVEPIGSVGPEVLEAAKALYRTRFHGVDDPVGRRRKSA